MYACRGRFPQIPRLDEFSVSAAQPLAASSAISGDEIVLARNPRIRIAVSGGSGEKGKRPVRVRLIRSGSVIHIFTGTLAASDRLHGSDRDAGRKDLLPDGHDR